MTRALFMGAAKKRQSQWVMVGQGGAVATSPDGITWTASTGAATRDWAEVIFANKLFVAVGGGSGSGVRLMTSPDGVTWTSPTLSGSNAWNAIAYGPDSFSNVRFVAIGNAKAVSSPDGVTWTLSNANPPSGGWISICPGLSGFIAIRPSTVGGDTSTVASGNGGVNDAWAVPTDAKLGAWASICYAAGIGVVAVGATGWTNQVVTSTGSITSGSVWTTRTAAAANEWTSVCYGKGLFVAVSSNGTRRVMTSPNGTTWTLRDASRNILWQRVAFGDGLFIACGIDNDLTTTRTMISTDGITWADGGATTGVYRSLAQGYL